MGDVFLVSIVIFIICLIVLVFLHGYTRDPNRSYDPEEYRRWWENKLPEGAEEKGVYAPFSDMGGHEFGPPPVEHTRTRADFKCDVCGAIIRWDEDGLYKVIEGPKKCDREGLRNG